MALGSSSLSTSDDVTQGAMLAALSRHMSRASIQTTASLTRLTIATYGAAPAFDQLATSLSLATLAGRGAQAGADALGVSLATTTTHLGETNTALAATVEVLQGMERLTWLSEALVRVEETAGQAQSAIDETMLPAFDRAYASFFDLAGAAAGFGRTVAAVVGRIGGLAVATPSASDEPSLEELRSQIAPQARGIFEHYRNANEQAETGGLIGGGIGTVFRNPKAGARAGATVGRIVGIFGGQNEDRRRRELFNLRYMPTEEIQRQHATVKADVERRTEAFHSAGRMAYQQANAPSHLVRPDVVTIAPTQITNPGTPEELEALGEQLAALTEALRFNGVELDSSGNPRPAGSGAGGQGGAGAGGAGEASFTIADFMPRSRTPVRERPPVRPPPPEVPALMEVPPLPPMDLSTLRFPEVKVELAASVADLLHPAVTPPPPQPGWLGTAAGAVTQGFGQVRSALTPDTTVNEVATQRLSSLGTSAVQLASNFSPLGMVATLLEGVFAGMAPLLEAFSSPLRIVGELLGTLIAPVLRIFFPIIKTVAIAFTYAGQIIAYVIGGIAKVAGEVISAVGSIISRIPLLGGVGRAIQNFGRGIVAASQDAFAVAGQMSEARDRLRDLTFEEALENVGGAAAEAAESLSNVPNAYRLLGARRWEASDGVAAVRSSAPLPVAVSTNASAATQSNTIYVHNEINAREYTPREMMRAVIDEAKREARAVFGDSTRWSEVM